VLRRAIRSWVAASDALVGIVTRDLLLNKVEQLEARVLFMMADLWYRIHHPEVSMADARVNRMLISHDRDDPGNTHTLVVTGTQEEIEAAAQRLSRRTRSCVTVAVIVGRYHRRGCDDLSRGGYIEDGD